MNINLLDVLYNNFTKDPENFYELILFGNTLARQKVGVKIEENLLDTSYLLLKNSREETDKEKSNNWFEMSKILRKAAHKIFYEFNCESQHIGFLRLI